MPASRRFSSAAMRLRISTPLHTCVLVERYCAGAGAAAAKPASAVIVKRSFFIVLTPLWQHAILWRLHAAFQQFRGASLKQTTGAPLIRAQCAGPPASTGHKTCERPRCCEE